MEASDMLDVIHVLFEEDILPKWDQESEAKDQMRSSIYRQLYGVDYKYGSNATSASPVNGDFESPSLYDEPANGIVKPYFPPTSPEDLQSILGMPVGE